MRPSVSNEEFEYLKVNKVRKILAFLPSDRDDCECFNLVKEWSDKLGRMSKDSRLEMQQNAETFKCPKAEGMKKYEIFCGNCGDKIAEVSALDDSLSGWCDLHYYSESRLEKEKRVREVPVKKGKKLSVKKERYSVEVGKWHGCLGLQVSAKDGKLGIECACGQDTRDFRINNNLTGEQLQTKLKENMIGRNFGEKDSKFIVKEVK